MILTCPACGTQYAVKDGAIPAGGRKVRCASCSHSWHQEPDSVAGAADDVTGGMPAAATEQQPQPAAPTPFHSAQPTAADGEQAFSDELASEPGEEDFASVVPESLDPAEPAPLPPPEAWPEYASEQDWDPAKELPDSQELDALSGETAEDRRRGWRFGILAALALVAAIAAAFWLLAPDSLRQQVGFGAAQATKLQIAPGSSERQKLASGNELVVVSGRVINPSSEAQPVPPIQAQLRDRKGKLVYSWTIAPPTRSLAPGSSATFNSAEMGVPPSGLQSTVTFTLKG